MTRPNHRPRRIPPAAPCCTECGNARRADLVQNRWSGEWTCRGRVGCEANRRMQRQAGAAMGRAV